MRRQVYGYGVGLGAFLASAIVHDPRAAFGMLRRLPGGLGHLRRKDAADRAGVAEWPKELSRLERRGVLVGPFRYALSRATSGRRRPAPTRPTG